MVMGYWSAVSLFCQVSIDITRMSNIKDVRCKPRLGTDLLIGCDLKIKIVRNFRSRLCDKNGLLCDKLCTLCDFFLSYFKHILLGFITRKPLLGCSKDNLNIKEQKLNIYT